MERANFVKLIISFFVHSIISNNNFSHIMLPKVLVKTPVSTTNNKNVSYEGQVGQVISWTNSQIVGLSRIVRHNEAAVKF